MAATGMSLRGDLAGLGLRAGDLVLVHGSMRVVGPVIGGVNVVIQTLLDVLGAGGTLAAYVDFEPFYEDDDDPDAIPVFDKRIAHAARDHGVLHETLRNWPGAVRSDHPDAGVAAIGARAGWLTADHPFQYGYGEGSPFEKVVEAGGCVLMLGAPLDTITLLHYAEHKARMAGKRVVRYRRKMRGPGGEVRWVDFEEFDTADPVCGYLPPNCFEIIAGEALEAGIGRRGRFGAGPAYRFPAPDLVRFAIAWLEARAILEHDARASL